MQHEIRPLVWNGSSYLVRFRPNDKTFCTYGPVADLEAIPDFEMGFLKEVLTGKAESAEDAGNKSFAFFVAQDDPLPIESRLNIGFGL